MPSPPYPKVDATAAGLSPGLSAGAAVWDAAVVLASYLPQLTLTGGWAGSRLLEVGCGAGLLAIAAARLGAAVTATDLDQRVLELCAENAEANGVGRLVTTGRLEWGELGAVEELAGGSGWDMILAADCLYQPAATRPLLKTLRAACALAGDGGGGGCRVLVGYKTRMAGQLLFFQLAQRGPLTPAFPAAASTSPPPPTASPSNAHALQTLTQLLLLLHIAQRAGPLSGSTKLRCTQIFRCARPNATPHCITGPAPRPCLIPRRGGLLSALVWTQGGWAAGQPVRSRRVLGRRRRRCARLSDEPTPAAGRNAGRRRRIVNARGGGRTLVTVVARWLG